MFVSLAHATRWKTSPDEWPNELVTVTEFAFVTEKNGSHGPVTLLERNTEYTGRVVRKSFVHASVPFRWNFVTRSGLSDAAETKEARRRTATTRILAVFISPDVELVRLQHSAAFRFDNCVLASFLTAWRSTGC